ncbi:MAG: hypothetical protein ACRDNK_07780 [Solirubrobacteraceae bacterium]
MLACAAALFVIASAVVAFRGWPKIAGQQSPAALRLDASPVAGSRVARRLRAVVGAAGAARAVPLSRAGTRPAANRRTTPRSGQASLGGPSSSATPPAGGGAGSTGGGSPGGATNGRPTTGSGGSTGAGGTTGGGGGVTVSVPTKPPVTVTVPAGPPITVTVPTGPVATVVKKVTGSAGNTVSQAGAAVGNLLGG